MLERDRHALRDVARHAAGQHVPEERADPGVAGRLSPVEQAVGQDVPAPRRERDHHREGGDERRRLLDQVAGCLCHHLPQPFRIPHHPGEQVAGFVALEKGKRQRLQLREKVRAYAFHHLGAGVIDEIGIREAGHRTQKEHRGDPETGVDEQLVA